MRNDHSRRRGYSLIELLAVLTMMFALMSLGVGFLQLILKLESNSQDQLERTMAERRLVLDLRNSVHAADSLLLSTLEDSEVPALLLRLPDARLVTFRLVGQRIERLEERPNDENAPRKVESYRFPYPMVADWEVTESVGLTLVTLKLKRQHDRPGENRGPTLRVQAVLGRDQRFLERED